MGENPLDALVPRAESVPSETAEVAPQSLQDPAGSDAPPKQNVDMGEPSAESSSDDGTMQRWEQAEVPSQCLTFYLGGEEYAVRILQVKEIFEFASLTTVPTAPAWIRGVMNLRGTVVPVVDLAVKFGLPETVIGKQTCVLIVEVQIEEEHSLMGVLVDSVSRVTDWTENDIEPVPSFGTKVHVDALVGLGKLEDKFVPILDINRALSADDLLEAVSAPRITTRANQSPKSTPEHSSLHEKAAHPVAESEIIHKGAGS